ncbi:MAG: phosphonoacetaldehyde hydrolase [Chloroflexota bacterium]
MTFSFHRRYTGMIQAVIFDWAGTTVDHGCLAPMVAFIESFKAQGVEITVEEARIHMGLPKRAHIAGLLELPMVRARWQATHKTAPTETDIQRIYDYFIPRQAAIVGDYADPIPGTPELMTELRNRGIKIGSCTGYNREIMAVLVPRALERGYNPDATITPDTVGGGRPGPWMALQNAIALQVYPMEAIIKVGDTIADIEEGLNAGMWTVGVARTGNELGLSAEEVAALSDEVLLKRLDPIYSRFKRAGAHYVIDSITELIPVIEDINDHLVRGERP